MSTRSTLGYLDDCGDFRGTYIHFDGMTVGREAGKAFASAGYNSLVEWIETGIAGGGYASFGLDETSYGDEEGPNAIGAGDYFGNDGLEFAWVVTPEGVVLLETYLHTEKANDVAYWDCFLAMEEKMVGPEGKSSFSWREQLLAVDKIAATRFGKESATYASVAARVARMVADIN